MASIKIVLAFFFGFFQLSFQSDRFNESGRGEPDGFYRAAVVDFAPDTDLEDNLRQYEWFIKKTKEEEADIIVFPENALYGAGTDPGNEAPEIPDPRQKIIPCGNKDFEKWKVLERLSCAARESRIYAVVNLLENVSCNGSRVDCRSEGGGIVYRTNVVFDRNGTVASRHRKYNYTDEYSGGKTSGSELEIFETDFGVRFGILNSCDILFRAPAMELVEFHNVTNFVLPTYWHGELPFFTGIQAQNGWSFAMDVNLLAAGATKPSTGTGGSGIYIGKRGPTVFSFMDGEASTALISRVPKNNRLESQIPSDYRACSLPSEKSPKETGANLLQELTKDPTVFNMTSVVLKDTEYEFEQPICSDTSFCCYFRITYRKNKKAKDLTYSYRAVAYQGLKSFGNREFSGGVEFCAVVLCPGPDLEDCGNRPNPANDYVYIFDEIIIEATFKNNGTVQMPNVLIGVDRPDRKTKMLLLGPGKYDFWTDPQETTKLVMMDLRRELRSVITFGIYGMDFT